MVAMRSRPDGPATLVPYLDPALIAAFLDGLETRRGNSARSRNLRLTAIRSFFGYAAFEDPAQSGLIQRVLAMPSKRYEKKLVKIMVNTKSWRTKDSASHTKDNKQV